MKIFMCVITILCILFLGTVCYALSMQDDGHAWRAASEEVKIELAEELSATIGKHYMWWVGALDAFYNTTDENILSVSIKNATNMLPYFDEK